MMRELPQPLLSAVVDGLPLGVLLLEPRPDAEGWPQDFVIRAMNRRAAEELSGDATWLGRVAADLAPRLGAPEVVAALVQVARFGASAQLEQHAQEEGRELWQRLRLEPLSGLILVTLEDVSQQKRFEEHIRRMAFHDELTGIHNRRYFSARLPSQLALARRHGWQVALLFLDLNGFKVINDQHGHRQGDRVLQAVAGRLRTVCRESDLFFRASGDEFALFLPEASEAAALKVAQRVAERLEGPFQVGEAQHEVGASIGVAVMPSAEASLDELLERSDAAMYAAKARKGAERSPIVLWSPDLGEG